MNKSNPVINWRRPAADAKIVSPQLKTISTVSPAALSVDFMTPLSELSSAVTADNNSDRGYDMELSLSIKTALEKVGTPVTKNAENNPKEDAIGLLKLAAEIEHALMVQYLYAAQSASADVRSAIIKVAIEEMGHLMTVQNLLLAITGVTDDGTPSSLHFGRDNIRAHSAGYNPMPLVLEPISETALKKFVLVEQPGFIADEETRKTIEKIKDEIDDIIDIHPVHALYAAIRWIFQECDNPTGKILLTTEHNLKPGHHLRAEDFVAKDVITQYASDRQEWKDLPGLLVIPVTDSASAIAALDEITSQGEGSPNVDESHFQTFFSLLLDYSSSYVKKKLTRSPHIEGQATEDANAVKITNTYTHKWAALFNTQYELLIIDLAWAVSNPKGSEARKGMIVFTMKDGMRYITNKLADILADLPVADLPGSIAGPTYGLTDETVPSSKAAFRTRYQALFQSVSKIINDIKSSPEFENHTGGKKFLEELINIDNRRTIYLP